MRRIGMYAMLCGAAAMGMMGTPGNAAAQVAVRAQLYWSWNDGAWRPHRYDWDGRADRYLLPGAGLQLSVGYLPPAGYCREWIPGVPPAYQPPPVPCAQLFLPYGYAQANVVIIGSPGYRGPVDGLRFTRVERDRFARARAERERRSWNQRSWDRGSWNQGSSRQSTWNQRSRPQRTWDQRSSPQRTWNQRSSRQRTWDRRSSPQRTRDSGGRGHGRDRHGRG